MNTPLFQHHLQNPEIQRLLDSRVQQIAGVQNAVVLSDDGLPLYFSQCDQERADKHASLASGLASLALAVARENDAGFVQECLIKMEQGWFLVSQAGENTYTAITTRADVDLGVIGFEVTRLCQDLNRELALAQRATASAEQEPGASGGGGAPA